MTMMETTVRHMPRDRHSDANSLRPSLAEAAIEVLCRNFPARNRVKAIASHRKLNFSVHTVRRWLDGTNRPDVDAVDTIMEAFPEDFECLVWKPLQKATLEREINEIDRQSAALAQHREALAKRMESSGASGDPRP